MMYPSPSPVWAHLQINGSSSTSTKSVSRVKRFKTISKGAVLNLRNLSLNEGYYRVAYDPTNYALIRDQLLLDHTQISLKNRAQLLDDSLNIARVNIIPYSEALDLTLYLTKEREYVPFYSALTALNYIDSMFSSTGGYGDLKVNYKVSLKLEIFEILY